MNEQLMLALLDSAERWASRAHSTLARRHEWTPAFFAAGRRPEERALLSAAAEVYDLLGATAEGAALLVEVGLNPEAGALPTVQSLSARFADHLARAGRLPVTPADEAAA